MKTKDLIQLLNKADSSGEEEVCVGNHDILAVYGMPAYYDGCLQVLVRDKTKEPYYNVVGAKYVRSGVKINIQTWSIEDAIYENSKLPVDIPEVLGNNYLVEHVKQWREDSAALEEKLRLGMAKQKNEQNKTNNPS